MRLLWFVVGVGAGNTTRTLAVLDALKDIVPDLDIHLAAQGKALELLGEKYTVHPLQKVSYASGGQFGALNIIKSNLNFPQRFMQNRARAFELMREINPDVVLADSDFYCLSPARTLRIPLVSLNSSLTTKAQLERYGVPKGCGFSGHFIERMDAWLQRRYPNKVISPALRPEDDVPRHCLQIPPIVRSGLNAPPPENHNGQIVVVTGGSGIGVGDIDLSCITEPVSIYGSHLENAPSHAVQHGFTLEAKEVMKSAKVLVVQGGFSSVSEAVALRRPTVVVPITG